MILRKLALFTYLESATRTKKFSRFKTAPQEFPAVLLFHFWFYVLKKIVIEEIDDRDPQPVTQLLKRGDGGAVVATADHIVHGGLSDAADRAQFVNSQISLCT